MIKNKTPKKKNDGLFSKAVIVLIFAFLFLFTIAVLVIFVITGGIEPSTLIMSVFGLCGCEFGILGWIKTSKEKKDEEKRKKLEEIEKNIDNREE